MAKQQSQDKIWRTFSIFISSTFADMQAERDYLKTYVFPKVEEELQQRRIKLQIVDLRWGVDTTSIAQEDEREATVLKVCLDEIKRCRPFFIGLLGDRYGWIPPQQRIEQAMTGEKLNFDAKNRSVTELEIEYGVLASTEQLMRSVFYFREPLSYETFSPERAAMFSDEFNTKLSDKEKESRIKALVNLKSAISTHFEKKNLKEKVKTYTAHWDTEQEKVTKLKAWGDMVYQDILDECRIHAEDTWDKVPKDWMEQELALLDGFIEQHFDTFGGRKELLGEIKQHLLSPDKANWGMVLTGESGSGKSSVFTMTKKAMEQENCFVLAHSAGLSPRAKNVIDLLLRWNMQLAIKLRTKEETVDKLAPSEPPAMDEESRQEKTTKLEIEKIQDRFKELLFKLAEKQQVVLLVDALDRFEPTERAQFMTWLPTHLPGNIRLFCTAITGTEKNAIQYHSGLFSRDIDHFTQLEAKEMLSVLCKRQSKTLPHKVEKIILDKMRNDGHPACSSPLWLSLAVNMLMSLDHDDFEKMRQIEDRGDIQIETYMAKMSEGFDPLPGALFIDLTQKAGEVFGKKLTKAIFNFLACSRNGLREKDLEQLLAKESVKWNPLQFSSLRRWFKSHLVLQGEELQWNLAHSILQTAIIQQIENAQYLKLHNSIADYLLLLKNDPLKSTETMYHLIHAGNNKAAAEYYSSDLSDQEETGATAILTETITADAKGMELVSTFPGLLVNNLKSFHSLLKRFVYGFNDALAIEGKLAERLTLLEKLKSVLEKFDENNFLDKDFGYDTSALYGKLGFIHESMGHMEEALTYFEKDIELAKELYESNPRNESLKNSLAISYSNLGEIHRSMGHLEEALKYLEQFNELGKELYESNPRSESLKNDLAISYSKLGEIYQSMGHMEEALTYLEKFNELGKELYESNPHSELLKRGLALSYEKLGSIDQSMGHMEEALKYFDEEVLLFKELYESNPHSESIKNGLAISYSKLGVIHQSMGHLEEALTYYEKDIELAKELYESNPHSESIKNGLAISYSKLGVIHQSMGHLEEALTYYEKDIELAKELYESNPHSESMKNGLAISYEKLGDIHWSMGHLEEALKYFEKRSELSKELYESNPHSESMKNGLAISYSKLGEIHQSMGHLEEALTYFETFNELIKELHESNPRSESMKRGLAISYEKIGDIHLSMGHLKEALKYFDEEVLLFRVLYESNPQNINLLEGLGISYHKLAMVYKQIGDNDNGRNNFGQWKSIVSHLATNQPQVSKYQEWNKLEY